MNVIIVSDQDLKILWTNAQFAKLVDGHPAKWIGESLAKFFGEEAGVRLSTELEKARRSTEPVRFAAEFDTDQHGKIELEFVINIVEDAESGRPIYHITVGRRTDNEQVSTPPTEESNAEMQEQFDRLRRAYPSTHLKFADAKRYYSTLEEALDSDELFRSANFTIDDAARLLGTNSLYVSQVTNFFSGMSFPMYVNSKRIQWIKRRHDKDDSIPVSEIWSMAGFGSYSSFNRYVKLIYGCSPGQLFDRLEELDRPTPLLSAVLSPDRH